MARRRYRGIGPGFFVLLVLGGLLWASDRITLQGERTVYAVDCAGGVWDGSRCSGRLVAGPRYAFRASARRHEVIYWVRDSKSPSGKFSDCNVTNRDNWTCTVQVDQPMTVAYGMRDGHPMGGGPGLTLPYHAVAKWKWWAIRGGLRFFTEADG